MATITFKKGDEYVAKIAKLAAESREDLFGEAIYGAAGIVADEIRSTLEQVPTDERYGTSGSPLRGPKKIQKKGLEQGLGIAGLSEDSSGFYNVKIGFDGYNGVRTKRWPNGQPNQMVARSVEGGTSWMRKTAFVRKAVSATRAKAVEYMKQKVDEAIQKKMK